MECEKSLHQFASFLSTNLEIKETGKNSLQEFFKDHPDLILLMGDFYTSMTPACYQVELSINNEFRMDFAVSDDKKSRFLFIEFEDAKKESIFRKKSNGKRSNSYEWSKRYEHGFSQLVDWHYRMDDLKRTNKFAEHFGSSHVDYQCILIIGRTQFLEEAGCQSRFRWRHENTLINSKVVHCVTFDMLLDELKGRLDGINALKSI